MREHFGWVNGALGTWSEARDREDDIRGGSIHRRNVSRFRRLPLRAYCALLSASCAKSGARGLARVAECVSISIRTFPIHDRRHRGHRARTRSQAGGPPEMEYRNGQARASKPADRDRTLCTRIGPLPPSVTKIEIVGHPDTDLSYRRYRAPTKTSRFPLHDPYTFPVAECVSIWFWT
jgi:hypothetical protein